MTYQLAIVLFLLLAAIIMFATNRPRMDAVALIMLVVLPFTGVMTMSEALAGFSDANIVLIAALFVIGDGLVRTGVARLLGDWLIAKAGRNEVRLVALLMVVVCGLGATMSSTAVTAIFIPVALRIAQSTGSKPSRLMMPISFAALISGMMTLIATAPNLVINSELVQHLKRAGQTDPTGLHFFSFTPFGVPILILGIAYMAIARRWLGSRDDPQADKPHSPTLADWVKEYNLTAREHRVCVTAQSPLVGKTLVELRLRDVAGANLVAIERGRSVIQPTPQTMLQAGDILFVDLATPETDAEALRKRYLLDPMPLSGAYFTDRSQDIGMAEVIVPATSTLADKTVVEGGLRTRQGLSVIGLRRGSEAVEGNLSEQRLNVGDTLLLIGPWKSLRQLGTGSKDLVILNLPAEIEDVLPVPGKAVHALVVLLIVVGLMISGIVPNVQAAFIGCLLLGALGIVTMQTAYESIGWKTLVLIVGMMPFSLALQRTGGVDLIAEAVTRVIGGAGTHVVLGIIFVITAMLGLFISNTATAILMAPVALAIADELKASPYPFAMIVALAASTAFMTPVSSPVNTLVVTPGNYTFGDFVRVGVPFSIIVLGVSIVMVPWLLPLYPN